MKSNRGIHNVDFQGLVCFFVAIIINRIVSVQLGEFLGGILVALAVSPVFIFIFLNDGKNSNGEKVKREVMVIAQKIGKPFVDIMGETLKKKTLMETDAFVIGTYLSKADCYLSKSNEKLVESILQEAWKDLLPEIKTQAVMYSNLKAGTLYSELFMRMSYLFINKCSYEFGKECIFDPFSVLTTDEFSLIRKASLFAINLIVEKTEELPTL